AVGIAVLVWIVAERLAGRDAVSPVLRSPGSPRLLFVSLVAVLAILVGVLVIRSATESSGAGPVASSPAGAGSPTGRSVSARPASSTSDHSSGTPAAPVIRLYAAHGEASLIPALEGKRPLFILSLGSDARPGQTITRQRSDSIHIIG